MAGTRWLCCRPACFDTLCFRTRERFVLLALSETYRLLEKSALSSISRLENTVRSQFSAELSSALPDRARRRSHTPTDTASNCRFISTAILRQIPGESRLSRMEETLSLSQK